MLNRLLILFSSHNQVCSILFPITVLLRSLGLMFDSDFKLERLIGSVVKGAFFHLLAKVKPYVSDLEKLIHALIFSRLDYWDSCVGLDMLFCNACSWCSTLLLAFYQTQGNGSIQPQFWPLCTGFLFRIDFKMLPFVFKSLNGLAPVYLSELYHVQRPVRALRSELNMS